MVLLEKWVVSFGECPVENDVAQKKCVGAEGVYDYFNSSFWGSGRYLLYRYSSFKKNI